MEENFEILRKSAAKAWDLEMEEQQGGEDTQRVTDELEEVIRKHKESRTRVFTLLSELESVLNELTKDVGQLSSSKEKDTRVNYQHLADSVRSLVTANWKPLNPNDQIHMEVKNCWESWENLGAAFGNLSDEVTAFSGVLTEVKAQDGHLPADSQVTDNSNLPSCQEFNEIPPKPDKGEGDTDILDQKFTIGTTENKLYNRNDGIHDLVRHLKTVLCVTCEQNCEISCDHISLEQLSAYKKFRELIRQDKHANSMYVSYAKEQIDSDLLQSLPVSVRSSFVPLFIPCDGHCLYHSISKLLFDHEDSNRFLRRVQLCEVKMNIEYYKNLYENVNSEADFQSLLQQSASFKDWGTGHSLQVFSSIFSRDIYVYSHNCYVDCWTLYTKRPENASTFAPIFIVHVDNNHFQSLVPVASSMRLPSATPFFASPMYKYSKNATNDASRESSNEAAKDLGDPIYISDSESCASAPAADTSVYISDVENEQSSKGVQSSPRPVEQSVRGSAKKSLLEDFEYESWSPNICEKLKLQMKVTQTEVLFINILKDEMIHASKGPWEENLSIFSVRSTYMSLWKQKTSFYLNRQSKDHVVKMTNSVRAYLSKTESYILVKAAMLAMGVPPNLATGYDHVTRQNAIDGYQQNRYSLSYMNQCGRKRQPKVAIPDYVCYVWKGDENSRVPSDSGQTSSSAKNGSNDKSGTTSSRIGVENAEQCPTKQRGYTDIFDQQDQNDKTQHQSHAEQQNEDYHSEVFHDQCHTDESMQREYTYDSTFEKEVTRISRMLGIKDDVLNYKPPMMFDFFVPGDMVKYFYDAESETFPSKSYPTVVDKYMNQVQKCCSFKRSTHRPYIRKQPQCYATLYGCCGCGLQFKICVTSKPVISYDVKYSVESIGEFKMIQQQPFGRHVRGLAREILRDEIKRLMPGRTHLDRLLSTTGYRFLHNNLPQLSSAVLKVIKSESLHKGEIMKDPMEDLSLFAKELIELDSAKMVKGFVQNWGKLPDKVHILTYNQEGLQLVNELQRTEDLVLHLDATGSVVTQKGITRKSLLLYVMLIKSENYSFPVAEAVSQRGAAIDIADMLTRVFADAKKLKSTVNRFVGVAVRDYSYAMIHGLLRGLNNTSLEDYLNECYRVIYGNRTFSEKKTVIFICTAHLVHAFSKLVRKHLPSNIRFLATHALARIQETNDLKSFLSVTETICKFFEFEFLEENELKLLKKSVLSQSINVHNNSNMNEDIEEALFRTEEPDLKNLRSSSPFYKLFQKQRETFKAESLVQSCATKNPYYCPKVVQLLEDYYVHLTPLFSSMILVKTGRLNESRITNSSIEGEFNFIKNIFFGKARSAVNIFIRDLYNYHQGKLCKVLETALHSKKRKYKTNKKNAEKEITCATAGNSDNARPTIKKFKRKFEETEMTAEESFKKKRKLSKIPLYFSQEKKLRSQDSCGTNRDTNTDAGQTRDQGEQEVQKRLPLGLHNLGRSCYINSLIQSISAVAHEKKIQLSGAIGLFYSSLYEGSKCLTKAQISLLLGDLAQDISGIEIPTQEDQCAYEYYNKVVQYSQPQLKIMLRTGLLETLTCKCGNSRTKKTEAFDLTVSKYAESKDDTLYLLPVPELVTVTCGECDSTTMMKTEEIMEPPEVLCLREMIFSQKTIGLKTERELLLPQVNLKANLSTVDGVAAYVLICVIAHIGPSINHGHYITYICKDKNWVRCDDANVSLCASRPTFDEEYAFISFYKRDTA